MPLRGPGRGEREGDVGLGACQERSILRVERSEVDAVEFPLPGGGPSEKAEIEKVTAVRKKEGPDVTGFLLAAFIESGHRRGGAARIRDALDGIAVRGSEENHPVTVPGPPISKRCIAERLGRAARGLDLLEFARGEEAEKAAVGGPEREVGPFRSRKRLGGGRIERPSPEQARTFQGLGNERDAAPVR